MKTVNEIYDFLGQSIIENAPQDWTEALLSIEILPDFSSYNGIYVTPQGNYDMSVFDFPVETGDYLRDLHKITTKEGRNKWNNAKFEVMPDKNFNMEFTWNQELQDEVDGYNREASKNNPNYSPPKWHWEK